MGLVFQRRVRTVKIPFVRRPALLLLLRGQDSSISIYQSWAMIFSFNGPSFGSFLLNQNGPFHEFRSQCSPAITKVIETKSFYRWVKSPNAFTMTWRDKTWHMTLSVWWWRLQSDSMLVISKVIRTRGESYSKLLLVSVSEEIYHQNLWS